MDDEQAFVVFSITGDIYDEFIGLAADFTAAQRLCMDDQKKKLEGWQQMADWRAGNTRRHDLTPVIDLSFVEDSDGDFRTTEESTFVHSWDRGYLIVPSKVQK
jgi:hypothetical protein